MNRRLAHLRRGSAYLLVVGASLMVTIIGLSVVTLAQINGRLTNQENDSTECEVLAQAALEYAAVKINSDPAWRTTYQGIFTPAAVALGRGTITFKITDTLGNAISITNTSQPVKVWGIARIGTTCRVFSSTFGQLPRTMPVLKTAFASGTNVTLAGNVTVTNGPASSNATMSVTGTLTGDAQALVITNTSRVSGNSKTLSAPLTMPPATTYNTYYQYGTDIPYAWTGNAIQNCLICSVSNPYGPVNPYGVYRINVPAGQQLQIKNSRLVGTFVINLGASATLQFSNSLLIQPPRSDFPSLIINAGVGATVTFNLATATLNEGGSIPNLNPVGAPYNGTSNATTADQYPSQIMGLVHVIGSAATIDMRGNQTFTGPLICDASITTGDHDSFTCDTNLVKFPPMGFTQNNTWGPAAGTYKRELDN